MLPEHGDSARQPEPFPVNIEKVPSGPIYQRGEEVLVTLRATSPTFFFTGFLIQARQDGQTIPHGNWTPGATATAVGCRDPQPDFSGDDTAAHQTGSTRNVQTLVFRMPDEPGRYKFEMTTVERFGIYWMYQFSDDFIVV